jgi:hypothetical protein
MERFHIINFHNIFSENAFCLSKRLGIDIVGDFKPEPSHTYIVFGAHEQAVNLLTIQQKAKNFKLIIINSEPPASQFLKNKYYISLMRSNIVWDYSEVSAKHLTELGIRVYSRYCFEFVFQPAHDKPRVIDIFFCGSRTDRREAIYKKLKDKYPDKNIVFDFDWSYTDQAELTKVLQNSHTVINIPYHNHTILESHRIHKSLACGCEVVSLYSGDKPTDDFYEPYVYLTHDLLDHFDWPEMPLHLQKQKMKYPHLVQALSHYTEHNKWILEQLSSIEYASV